MKLKNRYFAMRHGQSLANEEGIIVSDPANGVLNEYGLSDAGRQQAETSTRNSTLDDTTLLFSSDFSRARQTAEIVQKILDLDHITLTAALRERYFGDWEKTSDANYEKIWKVDQQFADRHENNVEPLNHVLARTLELIAVIEREYQNRDILLVSHGDTLQILQAGLLGHSLTVHRDLLHLETAEIRRLA
jgi:broad specificity phosphatase PhoE